MNLHNDDEHCSIKICICIGSNHSNIQGWFTQCSNLTHPQKLYAPGPYSKKRKQQLYDDDYVYDEYAGNDLTINCEQRKYRSMSQLVASGTTHNVKKYVQYFILHKLVTDQRFLISYDARVATSNMKENELLDELRTTINYIFYKETHPGLNDNTYLKTIIKNKKRVLTCVIKKIMKDQPSIYDNDDQILRCTLNYPGIRPLYPLSYYLGAKEEFEKTYMEHYPVSQINENHYFRIINQFKQYIYIPHIISDSSSDSDINTKKD